MLTANKNTYKRDSKNREVGALKKISVSWQSSSSKK